MNTTGWRAVYLFIFLLFLFLTSCRDPGVSVPNPILPEDAVIPVMAQPEDPDPFAALQEDTRYIIHAGGSVDGYAGSNSLEALQQAYEAGHRVIEMDFQFTSDGELACIHDWYRQYTKAVETDGVAISLEQFLSMPIYDRFTPMSLEDLAVFLREHPDLYIVTDIKTDNIAGAEKIAADYPDLQDQFILQIYHGDQYEPARQAGFEYIIYTLYALDWFSKTDTDALCAFAAEHKLLAYTFSYELCRVEGYLEGMLQAGVPLYVHTINGEEEAALYFSMGFSAVYTDEVIPID